MGLIRSKLDTSRANKCYKKNFPEWFPGPGSHDGKVGFAVQKTATGMLHTRTSMNSMNEHEWNTLHFFFAKQN